MAFDTNTMTVLVADHSAVTFGIYVLDAASGNDLFALDTVGLHIQATHLTSIR